MKCPRCGKKLKASGMCCNSGKNSGYQCYCENCKIMWIDTFDDRIIIDEFLTAIARKVSQKQLAQKVRMNVWTVKEIREELKKARDKEKEYEKYGERYQISFQSGYISALLDVLGEG